MSEQNSGDLEPSGEAVVSCAGRRGDAGEASYFGAAPPTGDRPHRYVFTVHALDTDSLGLDDDATPAMASFAALEHTIARASLTVTHQA